MKYPGGIKNKQSTVNYGGRGMNLEHELNETNNYYLVNDIAVIHKKPVPITVNRLNRETRKIEDAFYTSPSTTDYNGLYKGAYIDFEAKETSSISAFPLNNIHNHQLEHLKNVIKQGGIAFIIVSFTKLNKVYLILANDVINFVINNKRKSIPYSFFKEKGFVIEYKFNPRLDYLEIIEKLYFKENHNEENI